MRSEKDIRNIGDRFYEVLRANGDEDAFVKTIESGWPRNPPMTLEVTIRTNEKTIVKLLQKLESDTSTERR